ERKHRYPSRTRTFQVPLFPGYVFCHLRQPHQLPVLTTPGVLGILGVGKTPTPVENTEIESIRTAMARAALLRNCTVIQTGQRARIVEGPFAGVAGVVLSARSPLRLQLAITLLNRAVLLEIDQSDIALEDIN